MADHIWMIPVSGAGAMTPNLGPQRDTINVQWAFDKFPILVADEPCLCVSAFPGFVVDIKENVPILANCYGKWEWASRSDCGDPAAIVAGGRLAVGTVFSMDPLFTGAPLNTVEVAVKFQASVNMFSNGRVIINGGAGFLQSATFTPTGLGTWDIKRLSKSGGWSGWNLDNMRVELLLEGTTNPANVGKTIVQVEWIAIGLTTA